MSQPERASRPQARRSHPSTRKGSLSRCLEKCGDSWKMRAVKIALAISFVCTVTHPLSSQSSQRNNSRRDSDLYARLLAMTDSRTFDRPLVDSALASKWAPLRAAAALAVGQVGSAHGIGGAPLLRELLADRDYTVASNAAYALGLLRDSASVLPLSSALGGPVAVAREAAWALGEIGAPAREVIVVALGTPAT